AQSLRTRVFDESKHPREPSGSSEGGQFTSSGGGEGKDEAKPVKPPKVDYGPPLTGNKGHPATVASRLATGKKVDQSIYRQPSLEAMKEDPENFEHDMLLFRNGAAYPNLRAKEVRGSPDTIARAVIDHAKSNLRFLYDQFPADRRELTAQWYDGAR